MAKRLSPLAVLATEEQQAWDEYLEATRDQPLERYCEVEPWAWNRLNQELKAINGRRRLILEDA